MLGEHVRFLICPHCGCGLTQGTRSLACPRGHTFDIARQGYVSLLGGRGRSVTGDTSDMVRARADFLAAGHFASIAEAVARTGARELDRRSGDPGCVVDIGAGTGYYLHTLAAHVGAGASSGPGSGAHRRTRKQHGLIAVDVSKHAMRSAARLHPELAAVVADVRHTIPVATGSAHLIIDAFAPREPGEIDRVLAPDGAVLVVIPQRDHLVELVDALDLLRVDPEKRSRAESKLGDAFTRVDEQEVSYETSLNRDDVVDLVRMGPSAWHQRADDSAERLRTLPDPTTVSVSVGILTYRRH